MEAAVAPVRGRGRRQRWYRAAFSPGLRSKPAAERGLRFVVAHAWSAWWAATSVFALVWALMGAMAVLEGGVTSLPWVLAFFAGAAVSSVLGVSFARWVLLKPLRTWWYGAPAGILALAGGVSWAASTIT